MMQTYVYVLYHYDRVEQRYSIREVVRTLEEAKAFTAHDHNLIAVRYKMG